MVQTKTSRLLDRKTFQGGKPFGWISTLKEKILMPIQHLKLVFGGGGRKVFWVESPQKFEK